MISNPPSIILLQSKICFFTVTEAIIGSGGSGDVGGVGQNGCTSITVLSLLLMHMNRKPLISEPYHKL
jgi:hypothetical protein